MSDPILSLEVPLIARANTRFVNNSYVTSAEHRRFAEKVAELYEASGIPPAKHGELVARVTTFYPRTRHLPDGTDVPMGDVDATVKSTLDALEKAGFVDDDTRFVSAILTKAGTDRKSPWLHVEVWRLENEDA